MKRYSFFVLCLLFTLLNPPVAGAAAPTLKIRMLNGSEIAADRAWVQGEQLLYERRGFTGTVRMVDVAGIIDRELEEQVASCRVQFEDSVSRLQAVGKSAEEMRKRSAGEKERTNIDQRVKEEVGKEVSKVEGGCAAAIVKSEQNRRMFEEARQRARKR